MHVRTERILLAMTLSACGGSGQGAPGPATPPSDHPAHMHGEHGDGHGHHVGHRFDNAEEWAKRFDDPARDAWQDPDRVVAELALAPGMTVADIGAGTGYFESRLSAAVGADGRVLALDVEADMVRYMTERAAREGLANVTARLVPFDDPQLEPGSVDRILIVDTWHHIADRGAYAKKLAAALEDGGRVMIVDFTLASPMGPPVAERLAPEVVIAELAEGGLVGQELSPQLANQYLIVARRR